MPSGPLPIVALCGFLGSGKTTLLRRWRRDAALADTALIVHDLSDFGLDAELLADEASRPQQGLLVDRVAALHGDHARDQLAPSIATALDEIADLDPTPSVTLCESTGAARPWPLIHALTRDDRFSLRHFIVTVDALNLHRDYDDGAMLTGESPASDDPALRQAASVLAEQLLFASVIILTKVDTVEQATVNAQVGILQKLQPKAAIGLSAQAGLQLAQLEGTPAPDVAAMTSKAGRLGLSKDAAPAEEIESRIIRDERPFHPQRLHDVCNRALGTGVYRTKGFLWLASRADQVLLWQQSGSQIALELTGTWRAAVAANIDGKLLAEEAEALQAALADSHPTFGDRCNELTIIGRQPDLDSFVEALEACLCTDEEIAAWQNGEPFPDPWPQSLRRTS